MKKSLLLVVILSALANQHLAFAQQNKIDSLQTLLKKDKEDTSKVKHLYALGFALYSTNPDSTIILAQQALALAQKINFKKGEANAYGTAGVGYSVKGDYPKALENYLAALKLDEALGNKEGIAWRLGNIGNVYRGQSDYPKALVYHFKALKMNEELGDKKGIAINLGNIGLVYQEQSDYPKALDYYFKALKMAEEIGDKSGIARHLCNIGNVYQGQSDYPKALDYYFKALKMGEELGDKDRIAAALSNIGVVYKNQGDYPKALDYYFKALKMAEELGDKYGIEVNLHNIGTVYAAQADLSLNRNDTAQASRNYKKALEYFLKTLKTGEELGDKNGIAEVMCNIASVYQEQSDYPKALDYYFKALKMYEELEVKEGIALTLGGIGELYTATGKFKEAEDYLKKAIALDDSIGAKNYLRMFEESLSQLYDTTGRYKLALLHYKKATVLKDTLFNQEKNKEITRKEMNYEFDKKEAAAKAEQDKKDAVAKSELQKQKVQKYSFIAGALLLLVLAFVLYNRYRLKQKANKIITAQKEKVEAQSAELSQTLSELKQRQQQLVQSEKMASVGVLTAGIAHEINNPINFVSSNILPLKRDVDDLRQLINQYETTITAKQLKEEFIEVETFRKKNDIDYSLSEIDGLINGIETGASRTAEIVKGLRSFSRLDEDVLKKANINEGIESTLVLLQNKLQQYKIEVIPTFGTLPEIECYPGELNQVFMNVITNAMEAIHENGKIFITTSHENNQIKISIRDTGKGMSDQVKQKIFDPFFTTKEVGRGTGLGLSISYGIIEKHNGKIEVQSEVGKGTEFIITLPIQK